MTSAEVESSVKNVVLSLFIAAALVVVASYFLVLLMGSWFIFSTQPGVTLISQPGNFPVLLIFLFGFNVPANIGAAFALILMIFVLSFVAAWKWRESFHTVLTKSFSRPLRSVFNNFLFIMPLLSSMLLVAVTVIIYLQKLAGFPTGAVQPRPGESAQEFFLLLAYASVAEELGFRLIPIGIFTAVIVLSAGTKTRANGVKLFIASFIYPESAKRMVGLPNVTDHGFWRGITRGEWAMILVVSSIFAYAHIISDSGWQVGKVTSVFVQALFFGIVYIAYGFGAPILMHWFFNYYLYFFDPDIISAWFPLTEPVLAVTEMVMLVLGVGGWIVFVFTVVRRRWKRMKSKEVVPVPPAPPVEPATLPS